MLTSMMQKRSWEESQVLENTFMYGNHFYIGFYINCRRWYEKIPERTRVFKIVKTLENRAFEKKWRTYEEIRENDKNTFYLPRQYTYVAVPICVECLILLGFSRVRGKWKVRFRPSLDHLKCVRNKTKKYSNGSLADIYLT